MIRNIILNTEKDIRIAASIGMCSTEVTDEYNALYCCAESTLKYVKDHGRGNAACYLDTSREVGVLLTQLYPDEFQVNTVDREILHPEKDLVSFALELLGRSKNINDAVFLLLSRIGKNYHFDRVSIIEADKAFCLTIFPTSGRATTRICSWGRISMPRRRILKSAPTCMMTMAWPITM